MEEREYCDDRRWTGAAERPSFAKIALILNRRLGKEERLFDTCVGLALGHLSEDIQLPWGQ